MKVAHRTQLVPPAARILLGRVPRVVDQPSAPARRHKVARPEGAVARLADDAHGGDGDGRARGQRGADEALEGGARGARGRGEVHVHMRDKGRGGVRDEHKGHDAA